ncbi:hypothetical protein DdX_17292 [Ditylenchus destructor]|uniref:Uncharacterized protein n=1 Tax=Ditylenchus destructor TaxID=166010 RepID=A0AAD4MRP3_9BILA|nr:hypothetical protein DdX_17292 [Ditylenchus destructor]
MGSFLKASPRGSVSDCYGSGHLVNNKHRKGTIHIVRFLHIKFIQVIWINDNNEVGSFLIKNMSIILRYGRTMSMENRPCNNGASTKTVILTIVNKVEKLDEYKLALETVNCYANLRGYSHKVLILEDTNGIKDVRLEEDATIVLPYVHKQSKECIHKDFFFRRHCIVALYMEENQEKFNLVLFMDADVGVVNPNHTIHEYFSKNGRKGDLLKNYRITVEMVFYNRLFVHEIAAGGYLARNTEYSRQFLHYWADYLYQLPDGFVGTDNGALHIVLMQKFAKPEDRRKCELYSNRTKDWGKLFEFEACVREYFGLNETLYTEYDSQGQMRGRVSIRPFGKSWVRDSGVTQSRFSHDDFMFHQWKTSNMEKPLPNSFMAEWQYPFRDKEFNMEKCLEGSPEPMVPKDGLFVAQSQIDHELSKRIEAVNEYFQYSLNQLKNEDTTTTSTTAATVEATKTEALIISRIAAAEQNRDLLVRRKTEFINGETKHFHEE